MKIGISGHRYRDGADWAWVRRAITNIFLENPTSTGWSSLAVGADQIFAETSIVYGKGHVAVLPGLTGYRDTFSDLDLLKFDALLKASCLRHRLIGHANEKLFRKAGEKVVRAVDLMVFVWDGKAAAGEGGTGEIVAYARAKEKPYIWLDPIRKIIGQKIENAALGKSGAA